jgi:hypothetical protein
MAKWATEFDHAMRSGESQIAGLVKIAAPPGIAVENLGPFAAQFRQEIPEIRLETSCLWSAILRFAATNALQLGGFGLGYLGRSIPKCDTTTDARKIDPSVSADTGVR